jgi:hypothetical protein
MFGWAVKSEGNTRHEPEPLRQEGAQSGRQGVRSRKRCAAATADESAVQRPSGSWFYNDVKVSLSHPLCRPSSLAKP